MDLTDLHAELSRAGVRLSLDGDGFRATPKHALTDGLRARLRTRRDDVLAHLKIETELRHLLALLLPGEDHPDFPDALAAALANPTVHLEGLRASAATEGFAGERP